MKRLITIELIKLWNSRSSKVLIISYFVLLCFIALIAVIKFDIGPIQFHLAEQGIFNFPFIWNFNTYVAAILKIFLAIVIVTMMSNEYSNKTIKQNLIDGLSKKEFVLSKFLTVIIFAGISTLFVAAVTIILGLTYSDFTAPSIIFSESWFLIAYFIKLVAFFSFCLFLGMLVKKSAFALGFLFLWNILEWLTYGVLFWWVGVSEQIMKVVYGFFPLTAMSNLVKQPATRFKPVKSVADQIGETITLDYITHWYEYAIAIGWIGIFVFGTYKVLKMRDL